jgi:hypothetical protein
MLCYHFCHCERSVAISNSIKDKDPLVIFTGEIASITAFSRNDGFACLLLSIPLNIMNFTIKKIQNSK